jgi:hypothetical protein
MQPNNFSTENENTETTSAIYDHTGTTMNATDGVDNDEEMETDNLPDEDESDENDEAENEAIEDDGTPVLDEEDLEENDISEEEVDDIEWSEPK